MARYDKFEPKSGGFRAPLAADWNTVDAITGVGLDANGRVVAGAGNTGVIGVFSTGRTHKAGAVVDVMTHGELVEAGLAAGTVYYAAAADGALGTTAPAAGVNATRVGHTVEADRLIARVERVQG